MPGHPEQGGLYLVRGLANAVARCPFASASALRAQATALIVGLAHALSRSPLPDRVAGVDGNDVLYAGGPAYAAECKSVMLAALQVRPVACTRARRAARAPGCRESPPTLFTDSAPPHPPHPQSLTSCVEEIANAGAGDSRARASLLTFLPPLLRDLREKVLDVESGEAATGLLERLCLALKTADAAHPVIKETVVVVQRRLQEVRKAASAAALPPH